MTASHSVACSGCGHHFLSTKEKARCRCGSRQVVEVDRAALEMYREGKREPAPPEDLLPVEDREAETEPAFGAPGIGDEPAVAAAPTTVSPSLDPAAMEEHLLARVKREAAPHAPAAMIDERKIAAMVERQLAGALSRLPAGRAPAPAAPSNMAALAGDLKDQMQVLMMSRMIQQMEQPQAAANGHAAPDLGKAISDAVEKATRPLAEALKAREDEERQSRLLRQAQEPLLAHLRNLEGKIHGGADPNMVLTVGLVKDVFKGAREEIHELGENFNRYIALNSPVGSREPIAPQNPAQAQEVEHWLDGELAKHEGGPSPPKRPDDSGVLSP